MDRTSALKTVLVASIALNVLLGGVLGSGWLQRRKSALGNASTSLALQSALSATLLPPLRLEMRVAEFEPAPGLTEIKDSRSGEVFYMHPASVLTNRDIASAEAVRGAIGEPAFRLTFTPEGARKITQVTSDNVGKRLLILADGEVLTAPVIVGPIREISTVVTGTFDKDEVTRIVLALSRT